MNLKLRLALLILSIWPISVALFLSIFIGFANIDEGPSALLMMLSSISALTMQVVFAKDTYLQWKAKKPTVKSVLAPTYRPYPDQGEWGP